MKLNVKPLHQNALLFSLILLLLSSCGGENPAAEVDDKTTSKLITMSQKQDVTPPVAKKVAKNLEIHGDVRVDNYYWMALKDEQKKTLNCF